VTSNRSKHQFLVIAHNIRSLFNVGSIFRSGDAFGVSKVYLTGYTPTPENENHRLKISKTALGAESFVVWEHTKSATRLIKNLKKQGIIIVALENNTKSISINKFKPKTPLALLLGEEVGGINKKLLALADKVVEIPMLGKKESLNVSVAFGVAAYVISQTR